MKLVFATNNLHKLKEIRAAVNSSIKIAGLNEIGIKEEIPETASTLKGNAIQKAKYIYKKIGTSCFADDTGLEVEALNNRPGIYSARYAGEACIAENNVRKLLSEMSGVLNRKANFRTVIAFIHEEQIHCFEGIVKGVIASETRGTKGFGYDPVFIPEGLEKTFAQMSLDEKNKISHRSKALQKFISFLNSEILKK
jgi:XTP/dITP diphosphohydrolase